MIGYGLYSVTVDNYKNFMPTKTHYMANRTMHLNAYHPKWIRNKIQRLMRHNPKRVLEEITLEDIK